MSFSAYLGERPYNDDTLLLDSMNFDENDVFEVTEDEKVSELNETQISEQVGESIGGDIEILQSPDNSRLANLSSPANGISSPKISTSLKPSSTVKKRISTKKKKCSDTK